MIREAILKLCESEDLTYNEAAGCILSLIHILKGFKGGFYNE